MAAAQLAHSSMLLYACALALCFVCVADTIVMACNYRFYPGQNPPSTKLVFLAEFMKLLMASCFYLFERRPAGLKGYKALKACTSVVHRQCDPSDTACQADQQAAVNGVSSLLVHRHWQLTHGWRSNIKAVKSGARAMLVFSVPAVCYFLVNNLAFQGIRIMSAHTFTLLSDLKVITTCVLSYLVLDKHLNRQAVMSLAVLFSGICLGQYATSSPEVTSDNAAINANWVQGALIMSLVAVLSASAAVYTEWLMTYSNTYAHESLNVQNMRLYLSGTVLNGLFCVLHSKASLTNFDDMRLLHWLNVVGLAFMGLITALIIKRFGNIVRVYASCVASLVAAGISYTLFHEAPAPLFYVGCGLSMVATLQLQQARTQAVAAAAVGKQEGSKCRRGLMAFVMLLVSYFRKDCSNAQGLLPGDTRAQAHTSKESVANAHLAKLWMLTGRRPSWTIMAQHGDPDMPKESP